MKAIDDNIRCCLARAIDDCGGLAAYGQRFDVSHTTVMNWRNGTTKRVKESIFCKIIYSIKDYLGEDDWEEYLATTEPSTKHTGQRQDATETQEENPDDQLILALLSIPLYSDLRKRILQEVTIFSCWVYSTSQYGNPALYDAAMRMRNHLSELPSQPDLHR